jgi:hypothetical protein
MVFLVIWGDHMAPNLFAGLIAATGLWGISTWTVLSSDGSAPRELWTVTSSDMLPSHPTLVRAAVPRSLVKARATYLARLEQTKISAQ